MRETYPDVVGGLICYVSVPLLLEQSMVIVASMRNLELHALQISFFHIFPPHIKSYKLTMRFLKVKRLDSLPNLQHLRGWEVGFYWESTRGIRKKWFREADLYDRFQSIFSVHYF